MTDTRASVNDFLSRITEVIEDNLSNERFGVSELASSIGMSRSNLLRKIKKSTNLSASQFIRQVRLKNAMDILKDGSLTVSEVSYRVGFSSSSYFVKCFHDFYGHPPGEARKEGFEQMDKSEPPESGSKLMNKSIATIGIFILVAIILIIVIKPFSEEKNNLDNSIAVLPFKNDSNDSTNLYIINGLMESVLNNLQKIKDLRVISRTSVEKYRYAPMIIPEIAKELNVNYFVEGSGQKVGDEILLNIQLIEASTDKRLWSEQYRRKTEDIFELQKEIAKNIASQIQAIITPAEEARIDKQPTDNLIAYDYFLKGLDLLNRIEQDRLDEALIYFQRAIEEDPEYARAYAAVAITYYQMDKNLATKNYTDLINTYADKALLYDDQLAQSLIAKGLFYMASAEYLLAISYFEKALEYNPNSDLVYVFLVDLYANYFPDTEKYLKYSLRGLKINLAVYDPVTISFSYLHISNAFLQSGFIDEAEKYILMSLDYFPENIYSAYLKPYILFSRTNDMEATKDQLITVLRKDTSRLDVIQEVAKACFYLRDYQQSYKYYKQLVEGQKALNLNIFKGEDAKIGLVLAQLGMKEESVKVFNRYKDYADNDKSVYKNLSLAVYYSYHGETDRAFEHLRLFAEENNLHYLTVRFLEIDPLLDNIREDSEFIEIMNDINSRFNKYHKRIRNTLENENLI